MHTYRNGFELLIESQGVISRTKHQRFIEMTAYFDQKAEGIATGDGFVSSDAFSRLLMFQRVASERRAAPTCNSPDRQVGVAIH
jgi:hypothetical protein